MSEPAGDIDITSPVLEESIVHDGSPILLTAPVAVQDSVVEATRIGNILAPSEDCLRPGFGSLGAAEVVVTGNVLPVPENPILYDDVLPEIPAGYLYRRLGYVVPGDDEKISGEIHEALVQMLEARKMPFVFHKIFSVPYYWPSRDFVEQLIYACSRGKLDALVCVGEQRQLENLFARCIEMRIKYHALSRQDARRRYWRLGLITHIVFEDQ